MPVVFKSFGKRALSAAVFVVVLLGCILWNYHSFLLLFLFVSLAALREFYRLTATTGARPYRLAGLVTGVICYASFVRWDFMADIDASPSLPMLTLIMLPVVMLTCALADKSGDAMRNAAYSFAGILYAVVPFGLLHYFVLTAAPFSGMAYDPRMLLGIIFLIWANDTFAYLWGSLLGRRKLFERVSPGKTWEGTLLGALTAFGISFLIKHYLLRNESWEWQALGLIVPIAATLGDLAESHLKRQAGVKDSGNIMPGHGGVLDRFDSLLFVSPVVYVIAKLL